MLKAMRFMKLLYFYFCCRPCFKSQLITLKKEGYWNELMDEKRPEIIVKDW